jgi:hypothetical protein
MNAIALMVLLAASGCADELVLEEGGQAVVEPMVDESPLVDPEMALHQVLPDLFRPVSVHIAVPPPVGFNGVLPFNGNIVIPCASTGFYVRYSYTNIGTAAAGAHQNRLFVAALPSVVHAPAGLAPFAPAGNISALTFYPHTLPANVWRQLRLGIDSGATVAETNETPASNLFRGRIRRSCP